MKPLRDTAPAVAIPITIARVADSKYIAARPAMKIEVTMVMVTDMALSLPAHAQRAAGAAPALGF